MRKKSICIFVLSITTFVIGCHGNDKVLSVDIGHAPKSATKTFLVNCKGRCKDINATAKVDAGDPDIFASENKPPEIGANISRHSGIKCTTVGGADPGKNCVFPFKLGGAVYSECTLQSSYDGILWCSTLTDKSGNHVSGQGKWGHCAPECSGKI